MGCAACANEKGGSTLFNLLLLFLCVTLLNRALNMFQHMSEIF